MSLDQDLPMSQMTGACLCGECRFVLARKPKVVVHCHCSICRRAHAAAYGTYAQVPLKYFRWAVGCGTPRAFESSPGVLRYFCATCGSHLMHREANDARSAAVSLALLGDDSQLAPMAHVYAAFKAPWTVIDDALPRYDTLPARTSVR